MIVRDPIYHAWVCNFNEANYPFQIETEQEDPFAEVIIYLYKKNINSPDTNYNTDNIETLEELQKFVNQLVRKEKIKTINDNLDDFLTL